MDDLEVPILREGAGKEAAVRVWSANMVAIDQGDRAADWINLYLADIRGNRKLRFFRVKDSFKRATDPKYAPGSETGKLSLLDRSPFS